MGKIYRQNCKICGKYYEGYGQYFCSFKCKHEGNKRENLSEETLKKMSEARKGKKQSEETKRKISKKGKGRIVSEETREKLRKPKSEEWKKNIGLAHKGKKRPPFSEEWKKNLSESKKGNKFCLGIHASEEARKNMSKAQTGRRHPEEVKEKIRKGNKGKRRSEETRKKLSGKNGSNYKGGITPKNVKIRGSIEFRLWRESVFARDNWTCQKCKIKGNYLHSHHIKNFAQYPELRFAINNGIALCKDCHMDFHNKYGRQNNNEEQIKEFLNN